MRADSGSQGGIELAKLADRAREESTEARRNGQNPPPNTKHGAREESTWRECEPTDAEPTRRGERKRSLKGD